MEDTLRLLPKKIRQHAAVFLLIESPNVALNSFCIWLVGLFYAIACVFAGAGISLVFGSGPATMWVSAVILWIGGIAAAIWRIGRLYPKEKWDLDLSILKGLQVVVMIAFVPAFFSDKTGLAYVSLVMEFLQLGALVIYGVLCLRIGRRPRLSYLGYLVVTVGLMIVGYQQLERALTDAS